MTEQDVGHLQKCTFRNFWDSCTQKKTSEISFKALSGILGLLCAEPNVGNRNKCTFRNSRIPARRTKRQKSRKMHVHEFCDSCAQNKLSGISKNALLGILGLLCAEQNVGNLKKCTFRNYGTPVRSTRRQKFRISKIRQTSSRWNWGFQAWSMFATCDRLHKFIVGFWFPNPVKLCQ